MNLLLIIYFCFSEKVQKEKAQKEKAQKEKPQKEKVMQQEMISQTQQLMLLVRLELGLQLHLDE